MVRIENISIIGLGIIGGSLAQAITKRGLSKKVTGIDIDEKIVKKALEEKVIDRGSVNLETVKGSDLIFICTYVMNIPKILQEISPYLKQNSIVTDVGSTKEMVMARARDFLPKGAYFVGGHPMAGSEQSGFLFSRQDMFDKMPYIITPYNDTPKVVIEALKDIIEGIGAKVVIMSPEQHDYVVGLVSHIPQIMASAIVNFTKEVEGCDRVIGKGYLDFTRIVSSNPRMWKDILLSNKGNILELLARLRNRLETLEELIETGDEQGIKEFFCKARSYREGLQ